ncbi:DUF7345 domain-containing protein [Halosolutus halophilus]|uniref:DUF7345 domain-containing protein n=1 Tax=Halosolutus halophilus TaxID=1552990 RepID=UPI0022352130|nr:hypothetical protein [Halosolutus halophilus]
MTGVGATQTAAGTTQTAADVPTKSAFVVALNADGSARTTITVTFDLTTDGDRRAFEALRENTTARERRTDRFATRMRAIAARAENESGRDMQIHNASITFTEQNDTGIVALSATWDGLAVQNGDQLVIREPFSSGFTVDRMVRIIGPNDYKVTSVTPTPTDRTRIAATWNAGAEFDGFEATFVPVQEETATDGDGTGIGMPGFGVGVALFAVLVSTAVLLYRH